MYSGTIPMVRPPKPGEVYGADGSQMTRMVLAVGHFGVIYNQEHPRARSKFATHDEWREWSRGKRIWGVRYA